MDKINCQICSTKLEQTNITHNEYRLYSCENCDFHAWYPRKIDVSFYENDDLGFQQNLHEDIQRLPLWTEFFFKNLNKIGATGKKILDVGCGNGSFLKEMKDKGYDCYGLDLDRYAVKVAKKKIAEDKIFHCKLEDLEKIDSKFLGYFDIITFFEVIEHQDDLDNFINHLKKYLKPHGVLVGSTPNTNRWINGLGFREVSDYPPHHFNWFSLKSLNKLFEKHQFSVSFYPAYTKVTGADLRYRVLSAIFKEKYARATKPIIVSQESSFYVKSKKSIRRKIRQVLDLAFLILSPIATLLNKNKEISFHIGFIAKYEK
ncbi:class I SAM-dependent methyltransferase [Hippea sp. KM1]|uniref:class I SAM-dependent methyltransferase n=1 Tax=Hippea sp. KM1 TaxID=944481 RepID=UPI00046D96AB|nr:class I SAM-dependent methyltransferase [Hippea sp. KM1]